MEFRRLSIADLPSLLELYRQLDGDDEAVGNPDKMQVSITVALLFSRAVR